LKNQKNSQCNKLPKTGNEKGCPRMNRRSFIKATGATFAGLTLPWCLTSCDNVPIELPAVEPPIGEVTVGIVRKDDVEEMVRTAIDLAGGLGEIHQGDTVVIKPNIILGLASYLPHRVFTHPEVLRAVIKAVKDQTDNSNITVAEASQAGTSTERWARGTGILDIINEEKVHFLAWETAEYVKVTSHSFEHIDHAISIPKSLTDGSFDHFINVPMLKNHDVVVGSNVEYTCCMKNHVAILHPLERIFDKNDKLGENVSFSDLNFGIHKSDLGEISAELNLVVPKHTMNIVDALTVILTGGGAWMEMEAAEPGLILASKDRVACDSLGVAVLKHYASEAGVDRPYVNKSVWEQAQIKHAQHLNLGRNRENIRIDFTDVDNIENILDEWI
jgi:uncharacterized protein (DUF362 family)